MVKLSRLNRLLIDGLPFGVEVPVIQIDRGFSNQVISKEHIVIIRFNDKRRRSWESHSEIVTLGKDWVWLVSLILVLLVDLVLAASDYEVGITRRTQVT